METLIVPDGLFNLDLSAHSVFSAKMFPVSKTLVKFLSVSMTLFI